MVEQRGASLLEVLITVVVLSIGLLGIAGLQLASFRQVQHADMYYTASLQANDIADRMRANPAGVEAGSYNALTGGGTEVDCTGTGVSCTPAQLAQFDHYQWSQNNANLLPGGAGTVTGGGSGSTFTVTITWTEMGTKDTVATNKTFTSMFQI